MIHTLPCLLMLSLMIIGCTPTTHNHNLATSQPATSQVSPQDVPHPAVDANHDAPVRDLSY